MTVSQEAVVLPAYAPGDFYPDEENPVGIVFWIDPESSDDGGMTGKHGKIISMRQSQEGLAYVLATSTLSAVGADSDTDGAANSAAIAAYAAANPDVAEFGAYNWVAAEYGGSMVSSGQGRTPYFLGCDVRTDSRTDCDIQRESRIRKLGALCGDSGL